MQLHVLHEDPRFVVIAKPARLACHRSKLVHDKTTLADVAMEQFGRRIHLVHRLDRATSGCLMIAFDPEMAKELHWALRSEHSYKAYLAFVRGWFRWIDPVEVDHPVKDDKGIYRDAQSTVTALGKSRDPRCSLLLVEPKTGRNHQVRRHVRDLHHPVLRDAIHGDSRQNTWWRDEMGLQRLGLHCAKLDLLREDGSRLVVTCPPPLDLVQLWQRLPWWDDAVKASPELVGAEPLDLLAP